MKFCAYCHRLIPKGFDLWLSQKPYHPNCAVQVAITDQEKEVDMPETKQKNGNRERPCKYCGVHIMATMQVSWRGNDYHEDCLVKAIQEQNAPPQPQQSESYEEDIYDDYFPEDEEDFADDEIIPESNGHTAIVPEVLPPAPMVHVADVAQTVVQSATNGTATMPKSGALMLGTKGSRYVSRNELYDLETPLATATWQPVPHYDFVRRLLDGLWDRRMIVTDEKYAVSNDGYKLYGLLTLQDEYKGVNYAVGLKNSNDKSTRLSLAVGYVVKVCTNGMINGDYQPLTAKHTARFNLEDSLSLGIDRIKRQFLRLNGNIERKRDFALNEGKAQELVYKAFMQYKLPVSLLNAVHKELFVAPTYEEFKKLNLWSVENSFTTAFKKLQPTSQFEATSKLAKFIDSCLN